MIEFLEPDLRLLQQQIGPPLRLLDPPCLFHQADELGLIAVAIVAGKAARAVDQAEVEEGGAAGGDAALGAQVFLVERLAQAREGVSIPIGERLIGLLGVGVASAVGAGGLEALASRGPTGPAPRLDDQQLAAIGAGPRPCPNAGHDIVSPAAP